MSQSREQEMHALRSSVGLRAANHWMQVRVQNLELVDFR
jgi:hypothetical protein